MPTEHAITTRRWVGYPASLRFCGQQKKTNPSSTPGAVESDQVRAAIIAAQARERGIAFHEEMEAYFQAGRPAICGSAYLESVRPFLNRLGEVGLVEGAVWHPLGFAGCVDCVALVDGVLSIIDWKTASSPKHPDWVIDQHLQVAAYRAAVEFSYSVRIPRGFVVFAFADEEAQVFETLNLDGAFTAFVERFEMFQGPVTDLSLRERLIASV